jgi:acyl carrier protein
MTDTMDQITTIVRSVFDEYEGPVTRELSAPDVPQWDSLAHVQFMVMVEQETGIRFATKEIRKFANIGELVDAIDEKKKKIT